MGKGPKIIRGWKVEGVVRVGVEAQERRVATDDDEGVKGGAGARRIGGGRGRGDGHCGSSSILRYAQLAYKYKSSLSPRPII